MRNYQWEAFSNAASRSMDFRNYLYYGDVWVPSNLKQGDVIRADLPTYFGKDNPEIKPRNCLVLGVDIDPHSMQLEAIRIVRLSYAGAFEQPKSHEIVLDPREDGYRFKLNGLRQAAVLRTGQIEVLRIDSSNFGFKIDRLGSFSPEVYGMIAKSLSDGYEEKRRFKSQKGLYAVSLEQTVYAGGVDPQDWAHSDAFHLDEARIEHDRGGSSNFRMLSPETQSILTERMAKQLPEMILTSKLQRYSEESRTVKLSNDQLETQRSIRKLLRIMSNPRKQYSAKEMGALIASAVREYGWLFPEDQKAAPVPTALEAIPNFQKLLEAHFNIASENGSNKQRLAQIFVKQSIDPNSLRDLETLGVGGLMREPTINLPEQLWRGRYLMMRIPNLGRPDDMKEESYRPCALWRAFAKANELGEPVLAGLELHPCTRESAHNYSHKMKVRPLDTTVPLDSFLIASLAIRAPISSQYFQPFQPQQGNFYELLPHMVDAFETKRRIVEEGNGMKIYGLQTIPEDWIEIQLPEPPNEKIRQYLGRSDIRFVNGNKLPTPAKSFG